MKNLDNTKFQHIKNSKTNVEGNYEKYHEQQRLQKLDNTKKIIAYAFVTGYFSILFGSILYPLIYNFLLIHKFGIDNPNL